MSALQEAISLLPSGVGGAVSAFSKRERITEIRLRQGLPLSLTSVYGNRLIDPLGRVAPLSRALNLTERDVRDFFLNLCEGSLYRYMDGLSRGCLITKQGVRVGVCHSGVHRSPALSLSDLSGATLRIPYHCAGCADALVHRFQREGLASVLIYSPPGAGKTTLLRDLALQLSVGRTGECLRVAVVDERGELFPPGSRFAASGGLLDVVGGLSKEEGIERAVRLLNPQIILCDELGGDNEIERLLTLSACGVHLAASVHAASLEEVFRKPALAPLVQSRAFEIFCGLKCEAPACRTLTITTVDECAYLL